MRQTRLMMGMPITVAIMDSAATVEDIERVYQYFAEVDVRYSPYRPDSEVSRLGAGQPVAEVSAELRHILQLCDQTKRETKGYFDIWHNGRADPSGLVKGWAVAQAAELLRARELENFFIDAGGDIQTSGRTAQGRPWRVGIRNPFDRREVVKVLAVTTQGVATSGTAIRGQHIYNPHEAGQDITDVVSLTVIGPNVYEADRFATAAFAMGRGGIEFIEGRPGLEGYMIDQHKQATFTTGFGRYVAAA